jgi:hypothetical protein
LLLADLPCLCLTVYFYLLGLTLAGLVPSWWTRTRFPGAVVRLERSRFIRNAARRRLQRFELTLVEAHAGVQRLRPGLLVPPDHFPSADELRRLEPAIADGIAARVMLRLCWGFPLALLLGALVSAEIAGLPWTRFTLIGALIGVTLTFALVDRLAYRRSAPREVTTAAALSTFDIFLSRIPARGESWASRQSATVEDLCAVLLRHVEYEPRRTSPMHRELLRRHAQHVTRLLRERNALSLSGHAEASEELIYMVVSVIMHAAQATTPAGTTGLVDDTWQATRSGAPAADLPRPRNAPASSGQPPRAGSRSADGRSGAQWRGDLAEAVLLLVVAAIAYLVSYQAAHGVFEDIAYHRFSPSDTAQVITAVGGAIAAGGAGVAGVIKACAALVRARAEMVRARVGSAAAEDEPAEQPEPAPAPSEA